MKAMVRPNWRLRAADNLAPNSQLSRKSVITALQQQTAFDGYSIAQQVFTEPNGNKPRPTLVGAGLLRWTCAATPHETAPSRACSPP